MEYFVPRNSHLVVLLFLGTGFLAGMAGLLFVSAALRGRLEMARRLLAGTLALVLGYGVILGAVSWRSQERVLAAGEHKYFCEVDCHLAYSVTGVERAQAIGQGESAVKASGEFFIVTLRTWFDEDTISRTRGNGLLHPNDRILYVVDDAGRRYPPSLAGQRALECPAGKLVPLTQPLRPGEAFESTFVFDLPADARNPRLLLADPFPVNWFLIGHENSFGHEKIYFGLATGTAPAHASASATPN